METDGVPTTYRAVLAVREARQPFAGSCAARLSFAVLPLALILLIHRCTGSFAVAGLASGAMSLTVTVLAPARARLVDLRGARRGLLWLTASYLAGLGTLVVLAETGAAPAFLIGAAAVAGAFAPPLGPTMRVLWARILHDRRGLLQKAYALDSVAEEVLFTSGPLLAGALIALAAPPLAMATVMLLIAAGTAAFVLSPASRTARAPGAGGAQKHTRPMTLPGMQTLVLSFTGVGLAVGVLEVALPYIADRSGSPGIGGALLALLSAGSAIGGLTYGRVRWRSTPTTQFSTLAVVFVLALLPLCLAQTPAGVAVSVFIAGLALAPLFICAYLLVNNLTAHTPTSATEANTWVSTANNGGAAAGSALAGLALESHGSTPTFTAAFLLVALITSATLLRRTTLTSTTAGLTASVGGESGGADLDGHLGRGG